jgi:putrescine transport system ATP-binding protein
MTMADRMAVMDHGRLVQTGAPDEIYEAPASRYVAEFVGDINILTARSAGHADGLLRLDSDLYGRILVEDDDGADTVGETLDIGIRPEKIALSHDEPVQAANKLSGEIWDIGYLGDVTMVQVMVGGEGGRLIKVSLVNRTRRSERPFAWEDQVWLSWDVEAGMVLRS